MLLGFEGTGAKKATAGAIRMKKLRTRIVSCVREGFESTATMSGWLRIEHEVCVPELSGAACMDTFTFSTSRSVQAECHDINKLAVREKWLHQGMMRSKASSSRSLRARVF